MTITYYLTMFMFFMLVAAIFLLIYIAVNISWIKTKLKSINEYQNENHYKFIRMFENTSNTNQKIDKLYDLKDSLDAKKNFIEGLEHGKKEDRSANERNA